MIEARCLTINELNNNEKVLHQLIKECLEISGYSTELADEKFESLKNHLENDTAILMGAFIDNRLVGMNWSYRFLQLGNEELHIAYIAVLPEARGNGVGRSLVEKTYELASNMGLEKVGLNVSENNAEAIKFYERLGFVASERRYQREV